MSDTRDTRSTHSVNKCETARHGVMPSGCPNARHEQCDVCRRCYTCHAANSFKEMESRRT